MTMFQSVIVCLENIAHKIVALLSTVGGWLVTALTALFAFMGDEKQAFCMVGIAIVVDMFWGICVSIRRGDFILSLLGRETVYKILIYGCVLYVMLGIERSLSADWGIGTRVACGIAAACELWSAAASMLIIKPNMPFLRLLRRWLEGEIASKLSGADKNEIKNILRNGQSKRAEPADPSVGEGDE